MRWFLSERLRLDAWDKQLEIAESVFVNPRTTVASGHGVGKTWISAGIALAFLHAWDNAVVVTTAPVKRQVETVLWGYIRKMHTRARLQGKLLRTQIRMPNGDENYAIGFTATSGEAFSGIHPGHLLVIVDEASGVPAHVEEAVEGLMAAGDPHLLLIGNPTQNAGWFYDSHHTARALYRHMTISVLDTPEYQNPGSRPYLSGRRFVEERRRVWGEDSPLYQVRVLGKFASAGEKQVIPLAWVEIANQRWIQAWEEATGREWHDEEVTPNLELASALYGRIDALGVDVSETGDNTTLAPRIGTLIAEVKYLPHQDTMQTTGEVKRFWAAHGGVLDDEGNGDGSGPEIVIDSIGIGAGPLARLREQGVNVVGFNAAARTPHRDQTGDIGFFNKRAEAWWSFREMLDPTSGYEIALPPDDRLTQELIAPRYRDMSGGRIAIESKDELRKRLGRSTDAADAVIQAFVGLKTGPEGLIAAMRETTPDCPRCGQPVYDPTAGEDLTLRCPRCNALVYEAP